MNIRTCLKRVSLQHFALAAVMLVVSAGASTERTGPDDGFCCPENGYESFGNPTYTKNALAAVDYDGDPYAYGPNDSGRDFTANAGHPGNWWGIKTDNGRTDGQPIEVQLKNPDTGKLQIYYVSQVAGWDPKTQSRVDMIDAKGFVWVVLTDEMVDHGLRLGDWVQISVTNSSTYICGRVEDYGNVGLGGEISECALDRLKIRYTRKGVNPQVTISSFGFVKSRLTPGGNCR
jgi:hypothetical protein